MKVRSLTHWGLYDFHVQDGEIIDVTPDPRDPDPSTLGRNLILGNRVNRVAQPAVRKSYLESGPSSRNLRGKDEFVTVSWDEALDLTASELSRVRKEHGSESIYGGSYGWASAGRFHHALSQLHRFLTLSGGYTSSRNAYSFAAAEVILPHIIGDYETLLKSPTSWPVIAENCELMVCFGGMPLRNAQITNGGMNKHVQQQLMRAAHSAGVEFVNVSPCRSDTADFLNADWLAIRPGTDVALMLAIGSRLITTGRCDRHFLDTYCVGFEAMEAYIRGESDGIAKSPDWAATITGISAEHIVALADRMADSRTMISLSWSLSRHQWGEQPYWMGITLAAMLGQIGLPGGGIGLGYGVENKVGKNVERHHIAALSRGGVNPVHTQIPVARVTEMLENPGGTYRYDNETRTYPDIRMIYWAGGNPFHHHQDLNRLIKAWRKPDTIICHELSWTATAKNADIVLPIASSLEREDIGGAPNEDCLIAMKQVVPPFAESRTDFAVFSDLAERLGCIEAFTENRTESAWVRHLYDVTRRRYPNMPDFEEFWKRGEFQFAAPAPHQLFADFRAAPETNPLKTSSGKIQIEVNNLGHPVWRESQEWLGNAKAFPFHLISHQPATRLHSQLDDGETSQAAKINGMEPLTMNSADARRRGFSDGDTVRVYNHRGSFRAGLVLSDDVMPGVLAIATGAWWSPDDNGECHAGNPNAVTMDLGTSEIAQGPSALTCLVDVERVAA